jgi:Pyruvate/2-oxoacid:ferredoxin oxidoreductase delta subunit
VEILQAEDERGHSHHAFFKDAILGRFYAICNCCSCCCGAMHSWSQGTPILASSGYVAQVDQDLCAACGVCAGFCPFEAISVDDHWAAVDAEVCMGCGVCVAKCAQEALSLAREPNKGEPLEIRKLINQAAATTRD